MRFFTKLFLRSPIYTSLLVCLLAAGIAFSSIGVGFYRSARQQQALIEEAYTTTVIPFNEDFPGYMPLKRVTPFLQQATLTELLQGAPVEYRLDRRVLLGAVAEGMESWTTAMGRALDYSEETDFPYSAAVFAVQCTDVETDEQETMIESYSEDGTLLGTETIVSRSYHYTFDVIQSLAYFDRGTPAPASLETVTTIANADGTSAFEVGKSYLLRGIYTLTQSNAAVQPFAFENGPVFSGAEDNVSEGCQYQTVSDEILPLYTEFTGDLDAFLNSEAGIYWRDTVIPAVEQNYHAVKLMLTDNMNSVYWFNTGEASILQGRLFTEEEYQNGQPVCLVSASYAELNGLSVGDTLCMELYHPNVTVTRALAVDANGNFCAPESGDGSCLQMDPCLPENDLGIRQKYTIVGIYTAPAFLSGTYAFGADMVFATKASVPDSTQYEEDGAYIPLLNSATIQNSASELLAQYVASRGFDGSLLFFDQGYSEASGALSALVDNALRLFAAGMAFFAVTAGLFLFLCFHKMRPTILSLRRMGVRRGQCVRQMLSMMALLVFTAMLLGAGLSAALFNRVGQTVLSTQFELPLATLLWNAWLEFVVLLLLVWLISQQNSKVGLMQRQKRRKSP